MKLNKFIIKSAAVALIVGTALPLAAAAQLGRPAREPRQAGNQEGNRGICAALNNGAGNKMQEKRQQQEKKLTQKRTERGSRLGEKRQKRDAKLAERRLAADERRARVEEKLAGLAKDGEQKQAIIDFQAVVDMAVKVRRGAYNVGNEAFRSGLDQAISDRQVTLDVIVETYKLQVDAAETQAKAGCGAEDADQAQIRTVLMEAVKVARDEMRSAVQAVDNVGETTKALQDARKETMEAARDAFHATMEKARVDLKAVLESQEDSDDEEDDSEDEGTE